MAAHVLCGRLQLKGKMPLDEAGRVMVGMSTGKTRDRSGQFSRGMEGHQERQEQAAAETCYHRTEQGCSWREREAGTRDQTHSFAGGCTSLSIFFYFTTQSRAQWVLVNTCVMLTVSEGCVQFLLAQGSPWACSVTLEHLC